MKRSEYDAPQGIFNLTGPDLLDSDELSLSQSIRQVVLQNVPFLGGQEG